MQAKNIQMTSQLQSNDPQTMPSNPEVASGVANLGNTCYMNAVLQALAHAPELLMAVGCESHAQSRPKFQSINKSLKDEAGSVDRHQHQNNDDSERDNFDLLCELEQHLISVHNKSGTGASNGSPVPNEIVSPTSFVNGFIRYIATSFKLGVQEDSHEFLRLLIDAMQKSIIASRKIKMEEQSVDLSHNEDEKDALNNQEGDVKFKVKTESLSSSPSSEGTGANVTDTNKSGDEYPFRLFCGKVESVVKCSNCNATSSTIDPIEDIGLEVNPSTNSMYNAGSHSRSTSPLNQSSASLTDLATSLKKFITTEHISGYKCESCGHVGRATKESKLASIPPILTLHLKRFRYGNEKMGLQAPVPSRRRGPLAGLGGGDIGSSGSAKIEGHVKFQQILDLGPYLTDEKRSQVKRMLCRLFAVIVHTGKNSHSGHYICYVRNVQKNDWWKMDDARVSLVSKEEVFAAEAYMLFYRVVDHPVSIELKQKDKIFKEEREAERLLKLKLKEAEETAAIKKEEQEKRNISEVAASTRNAKEKNRNISGGYKPGFKRKRETPEFKSGEEWARKTTSKPKAVLQTIRTIQDYFSERITFKPEYIKCMEDEVENQYGVTGNGSGAGGGLSLGVSVNQDVQNVEDLRSFQYALWQVFNTVLPEMDNFLKPKPSSTAPSVNDNFERSSISKATAKESPEEGSINSNSNMIIPVLDQNDSLI